MACSFHPHYDVMTSFSPFVRLEQGHVEKVRKSKASATAVLLSDEVQRLLWGENKSAAEGMSCHDEALHTNSDVIPASMVILERQK